MVAFHTRDDLEVKALIRTLEAEHDVHVGDQISRDGRIER